MKKFWIKTVAFCLIFALVFGVTGKYLKYHWHEDTRARYEDLAEEDADSIDVLTFGTSEMYHAYLPVAGYYAAGITGYNLAIQNRSAMTTYYQLKYALKHVKPKVVVCDFVCLFDDMLPSESESVYRRTVDNMPDFSIKRELISEICRVDESQNALDWYLPMLRYHTMWNELTDTDFVDEKDEFAGYPDYYKGACMNYAISEQAYDIVPELWETDSEPSELADFSMGYYDKLIDLCRENDIQVVCVLTPKISDAAVYKANWPAMVEYLESRGVICLNYCEYDTVKEMGLNMYTDYADPAHLNVMGALKFSTVMAMDIKKLCGLEDRRIDTESETTQEWDRLWNEMLVFYANLSE